MTKSERQIMDLLWKSEQPLSCTEIVELSEDKTWKDSYVHSLIKSLMKKGLIKIQTFELISRSYARKFAPAMSKSEYAAKRIIDFLSPEEAKLTIEILESQLYSSNELKRKEVMI